MFYNNKVSLKAPEINATSVYFTLLTLGEFPSPLSSLASGRPAEQIKKLLATCHISATEQSSVWTGVDYRVPVITINWHNSNLANIQ